MVPSAISDAPSAANYVPSNRDPANAPVDLPRKNRLDSRIIWIGLIFLYILPVVLPALRCHFDADDVSNLCYHRFQRPPSEAVVRSVLLFLPYRRPVGGCLYLALYGLFGFNNPLVYHVTGLIILAVNVFLVFHLFLRLTGKIEVAAFASCVASVHGVLTDIWYNFGTVYEMLALGLMLAGFHLYLCFLRTSGRARWLRYCGAIGLFWLAMGGKEMAVTLPALLLAYEWVYGWGKMKFSSWTLAPLRRLFPFFVLALVASISRVVSNPYGTSLYAYHLDATVLDNLGRYLERLFYDSFSLTRGAVLTVLIFSLGAAILLRNRHMVFGWLYFIISLAPVIALPRVSGFFLYIPMVGLGLYVGSLAADVAARTFRHILRFVHVGDRFRNAAAAFAVSLCLVGMAQIHYGPIRAVRRSVLSRAAEWKQFENQLFSKYRSFPNGTALLFLRKPHVDWTLHQTLYLHYGKSESELRVWAPPNLDFKLFKVCARTAPESHAFDYEHGKLVELDGDVLEDRIAELTRQ